MQLTHEALEQPTGKRQVLHNAPLPRQNALPKLVVLKNAAGLNSSEGQLAAAEWRWLPLFRQSTGMSGAVC